MIIHLKLVLLTIFIIELLIYFKIVLSLKKLINLLKKLLRLFIRKNISDHWKEKVLFNYTKDIFFYSFKIIFFFIFILVLYWILLPYNIDLNKYLLSVFGIIETIIITTVYLRLKKLNE